MKMRITAIIISLMALASTAASASERIDLNGAWAFRFDAKLLLEDAPGPGFEAQGVMTVPGCFDVMQPCLNMRGTAMYRRELVLEEDVTDAWWQVRGMGLRSRYWIDGREVGCSVIPYATFELRTGPLSKGRHVLEAAVDNMFDDKRMKLFRPSYDFYAFGGFYHGMSLTLQKQKSELSRILVRTRDISCGRVELELLFHGAEPSGTFSALVSFDNSDNWEKVSFRGRRASLCVPDFKCWSPEDPNMHTVSVRIPDGKSAAVSASFGIRTVEVRDGRICINGSQVYLKGANRHESHPSFGSATPQSIMLSDLRLLQSIGGNFIRGAHYQQAEGFLDLCDRMGVLVWEESLGWGNPAAELQDPEFRELQVKQTADMVLEDMNHPSVIIFAYMNEHASHTAAGRELGGQLADTIRALDSGRLVSFACNHVDGDLGNEYTDILSFNTYPGWMDKIGAGDGDELREKIASKIALDCKRLQEKYPGKPVFISEMGTCAVYGAHDPAGAQWTEEFQAEYVSDVLDCAFAHPAVCGIALWQLTDCPSFHRAGPVRTKPFAQNLAGLYDAYRRPKAVVSVVKSKFEEK